MIKDCIIMAALAFLPELTVIGSDSDTYSDSEEYSWMQEYPNEYDEQECLKEEESNNNIYYILKELQEEKHERDRRKDRAYYNKYVEIILSASSAEQEIGKKAKRAAYEQSQKETLHDKMSLRRAQHIVCENSNNRYNQKIRRQLGNLYDRILEEAWREQALISQKSEADEKPDILLVRNAQHPYDKANSWQSTTPEVLAEKRLQDPKPHCKYYCSTKISPSNKREYYYKPKTKKKKNKNHANKQPKSSAPIMLRFNNGAEQQWK